MKKWITLGLAALLFGSVLTACGGKDAAGDKQGAKGEGEIPTVKWSIFGEKQQDLDVVLESLNQKIEDKINVRLDLEIIPDGEFNDKMKLKSTAGEDYDLTFTANWRNNFNENISREAFMNLDELFEEHGQGIEDSMPDWLLDVGKVEGELFAIPNQQIIARQLGVLIQKEYADKYGFDKESLTDISELEPFLDEIVANEPDMFAIDKRVDAVLEKDYEGIVGVGSAVGNIGDCIVIDKSANEVKIIPITEVSDAQLRKDNEWYKKGYLRSDIATITDNTADVKANRYVCSLGSYKPGWDAEQSARNGKEYIAIPIEGAYVKAISGIETMTAINVNSKNPEAAMKLMNLIYTDKEIFNELLFGLEDVHYTKTGENSVEPIEGTKYNLGTYAWKLGNQFNAWYLPGQEEGSWEETDKLNKEATQSILRGFTFDPSSVQSELAQIAAVVKEFTYGQYTAEDIEKYISDRNAKLEQAGLATVMEELQRQIDDWKK